MLSKDEMKRFLPHYLEGTPAFRDYVDSAVKAYNGNTGVSSVPIEMTPHFTITQVGYDRDSYAVLLSSNLKDFLVYPYNVERHAMLGMPQSVAVTELFSQKELLTMKLIRQSHGTDGKTKPVEQTTKEDKKDTKVKATPKKEPAKTSKVTPKKSATKKSTATKTTKKSTAKTTK